MVFVDTGALYGIAVPGDPRHADVIAWLNSNSLRLITTDYVIDETLTLLRSRREPLRAVELGRRLIDLGEINIHYIERIDFRRAWELFRDRPLKGWSFTDCTSLAVIERFHVKYALSFDRHFTEFAGVTVAP
jgi:predicted nucleic acid-binding protein